MATDGRSDAEGDRQLGVFGVGVFFCQGSCQRRSPYLLFVKRLAAEVQRTVPDTVPSVTTKMVSDFFGAHAYLVTQRGGQMLLRYALPIEHQVDGLFLTLHQLFVVRMRAARIRPTLRASERIAPYVTFGSDPVYGWNQSRGFLQRSLCITVAVLSR